MGNFTDIVNRLKTELSLTMDKEVAEFLGLSKTAFAERKRRGVFPKEALKLADLTHPEYRLDLEYILTGEKDRIHNFFANTAKRSVVPEDCTTQEDFFTPKNADTYLLVNDEEALLINFFRRSGTKGKRLIFDTAQTVRDLNIANMRLDEYTEKEQLKYTKKK